jgi:hypothetical protein
MRMSSNKEIECHQLILVTRQFDLYFLFFFVSDLGFFVAKPGEGQANK